jgi:hypothetical protein
LRYFENNYFLCSTTIKQVNYKENKQVLFLTMPIRWNLPVSELTEEGRAERNAYFAAKMKEWSQADPERERARLHRVRENKPYGHWVASYPKYK